MRAKYPNILFIMTDDHASHALSCYGSRINNTPNIDRIANEGMRFDNCFCTNSLCAPSRASILTGTYSHINGVTTLSTPLDNSVLTFPKLFQEREYQTAIVGKWHLGEGEKSRPAGFDYWNVLPGQGRYHDPEMIEMGERKEIRGYVTDIVTELSIEWLERREKNRPFMLMCHHKAPHRPWEPNAKHSKMFENIEIPEPETFNDDYSNRAGAALEAKMGIEYLAEDRDLRMKMPAGLTPGEIKKKKYQRFIKEYLRCVASVDDNVGRILDYLEVENLAEDTMVVYTSDQGFFLGDHGWFDKRFMYEESLRMPFLVRFPREVEPGSESDGIILNVDFAPTFLDCAGISVPALMQGKSFRPLLSKGIPAGWRDSLYYRYWTHMGGAHKVYAHYGVRTSRYKLIYYYADGLGQPGAEGEAREPEWELFDLGKDPYELNSVYGDPSYRKAAAELKIELARLQAEAGDAPYIRRGEK